MTKPSFLESHGSVVIKDRPAIFGCPLDQTSTFRSGSDKAPDSIRESSESIESYSPYRDKDLEDVEFADLGDLDFTGKTMEESLDLIESQCIKIIEDGGIPFALGGEHTVTLPVVRALDKLQDDFFLIHLDAHTDLREDYEGAKFNHATVVRRVADLIGPERLIQLGIRSGTQKEFLWMKQNQTLHVWDDGCEKHILKRLNGRKAYLTLDLDVLDPACLPGTGNPEAGGWFYHDLERFFRMLTHVDLIGADVVELNPSLDRSGMSSILASKIVRELLLIL